jgi:pimeloyl-ACP methyl ester carboxylesterase
MHGFPDDLHLYDRLLPHLIPRRRVVAFDFIGWGGSHKPAGYRHTAANQARQLDAVLEQLDVHDVVLVAHDASGPPGHPFTATTRVSTARTKASGPQR